MKQERFTDADLADHPTVKPVELVAATGAMFVLGISSYYLLKNRDVAFARRSFAIAAAFGMASILSQLAREGRLARGRGRDRGSPRRLVMHVLDSTVRGRQR